MRKNRKVDTDDKRQFDLLTAWVGPSTTRSFDGGGLFRPESIKGIEVMTSNKPLAGQDDRMLRSANLGFFAAETDQRAVLDFLFSSTDVRVFESYSEYDAELREFRSTGHLASAFPLGTDAHGNGYAVTLQLWSPSVMRELSIERFALDPRRCEGHTYRHRIRGGGLMQLYFGGVCDRVITMSHFGHQSQVRAQRWDAADGIDWEALKTLSNRIQYHLRRRLAAARVPGPVLVQAFELARAGYALKLAAQTPWQYGLPVGG